MGQIKVKNYQAKCETLGSSNDLAFLNQYKALFFKSKVDLRMGEVECDFVKRQVKKRSFKATNSKKQHDLALIKLTVVAREMDGLNQQASWSKLWIAGLLHQIHFMFNYSNVTTTPLPIENPSDMLVGNCSVIHVQVCPICSLLYSCDAPPDSLIDSIASLNVKTTKG